MTYEEMQLSALLGESNRGNQDDLMGDDESDSFLGLVPGQTVTKANVRTVRKLASAAKKRNLQSSNFGVLGQLVTTATGSANPVPAAGLAINATGTPQKNYKPMKLMIGLDIIAIDSSSTPQTNAVSLEAASGLYLNNASSCGDNLFPINPGTGYGPGSGAMNCAFYPNNGLGNGISWKDIKAFGIFASTFTLSPSPIFRLPAWSPVGTVTYTFTVSMGIFGPMWDSK